MSRHILEKEKSQRSFAFVSVFIALIGLVLCFLPAVFHISVHDGGAATVILGGLLIFAGLLSAAILLNRAKTLAGMLTPDRLLASWNCESGEAQQNGAGLVAAVISTDAAYLGGELYTFDRFSCRLESATLAGGASPKIHFVFSMPGRRGFRRKHEFSLPIPRGEESKAAEIVKRLQRPRP